MKYLSTLLLLATLCAACSSTDSVNILIQNDSANERDNVTVTVTQDEIARYIDLKGCDTLYLLNERNIPVAYQHVDGKISFNVPVVQGNSQKNYSLNTHPHTLKDNLLTFRVNNIVVHLE